MKLRGKFWLVVAGPLVLPISMALIVFALSSWGESAARSQGTPSYVAAQTQVSHTAKSEE